jgi:Ca2+-binding RTX toxin-like protein
VVNLVGAVTLSKATQWDGKTYAITDAGTTNIEISAMDSSTINLSGLTFQAASTFAVNNTNNVTALDATKYVSTQGLTFVGSSVADTVKGTSNGDNFDGGLGADVLLGLIGNDTISGGAGADTITGGAGADVVTGGAGADKFVIAITDGSAVGTAAGTFTGYDTITDFTTTSDTIAVYAGAATNTSAGLQAAVDAKTVVFANNQTVNGTAVTTLAAADFTDVTKVLAFITATNSGTAANNLDFVVVVNDATAGKHAMYAVDNATTDGFTAGEVRLLAINTGVAVTADFIA